jgi:hypothetical protein
VERLSHQSGVLGILTPTPKSEGNARVRSRHDCKCICHRGGVAMHFVPCCDGTLGFPKGVGHRQNALGKNGGRNQNERLPD